MHVDSFDGMVIVDIISGICVVQSKAVWCATSAFSTGDQVQRKLFASVSTSPSVSFINTARQLQESSFLGILSASGVILLGDALFWALYANNARKVAQSTETIRQARMYRQGLVGLACIRSGLAFAAAWGITVAIEALQQNSKSQVMRGSAALALHWTAFAFSFLYAVGIVTYYGVSSDNLNSGASKVAATTTATGVATGTAKGVLNSFKLGGVG